MASDMKKQLLHALYFAITLAVLVGVLKLLDWTPGAVDTGLIREYPTIAAVEAQPGIGRVRVPAYYPATIRWPPVRILAQVRPSRAVVMEFAGAGGDATMLVISQAEERDFEPSRKIRFHAVNETVPLQLRGREAVLEAGTCEDGSACSMIRWYDERMHFRMWMRAPSLELIRIAESMLH